jgi:hypothetical protein
VCERENLWDDQAGGAIACWACDASIDAPVRLRFEGSYLVLNRGTRVFRHHLERDYDFATVVAQVVQHPSRPDVWGLRNMAERPWRVSPPGGSTYEVGYGQTVSLIPDTLLDLGRARVTIVV